MTMRSVFIFANRNSVRFGIILCGNLTLLSFILICFYHLLSKANEIILGVMMFNNICQMIIATVVLVIALTFVLGKENVLQEFFVFFKMKICFII